MSSESPAAPVKAPAAGVVAKTDADLQEKNKVDSTEPVEEVEVAFEAGFEKADPNNMMDREDEYEDDDEMEQNR